MLLWSNLNWWSNMPTAPFSQLVQLPCTRGTMEELGLQRMVGNYLAPLSSQCLDSCQSSASHLPASGVLPCPRPWQYRKVGASLRHAACSPFQVRLGLLHLEIESDCGRGAEQRDGETNNTIGLLEVVTGCGGMNSLKRVERKSKKRST